MRIALISDSHSKDNLEYIMEYLKKKKAAWNIKAIIINGDILGVNEIRDGYGYNFNNTLFQASLDKKKILENISGNSESLIKLKQFYEQGIKDEEREAEFSKYIKAYTEDRYNYLF